MCFKNVFLLLFFLFIFILWSFHFSWFCLKLLFIILFIVNITFRSLINMNIGGFYWLLVLLKYDIIKLIKKLFVYYSNLFCYFLVISTTFLIALLDHIFMFIIIFWVFQRLIRICLKVKRSLLILAI
jgi:hypothetical protein